MNDLKFRCWHPKLKRFIYFNNLTMHYLQYDYVLTADSAERIVYYRWSGDDEVIHLSSKVLDGKSREIYEGDILYIKDSHTGNDAFELVTFKAGVFGWSSHHYSVSEFSPSIFENFEVVGNIIEHPELLK